MGGGVLILIFYPYKIQLIIMGCESIQHILTAAIASIVLIITSNSFGVIAFSKVFSFSVGLQPIQVRKNIPAAYREYPYIMCPKKPIIRILSDPGPMPRQYRIYTLPR